MASEDVLKKNSDFTKHYKLGKKVGEGSFGKVYLAKNKREKIEYAVKVIPTTDPSDLRDARQEIRILKDLEHPHIVHYKEDFAVPNKGVIVVMEYCERGDLQERIKSRSSRPPLLEFFPESQVVEWAAQTCKALDYLHSKYILHRDLKPANLLLADKDVIKLGDFGISKKLKDIVDVTQSFVGTPLYLSPEIVQSKPYNHKSDVWAAGCCFYEMMTLNPAVDPVPVRLSHHYTVRPMPLNYTQELRDVVESMLTIDSAQRPAIGNILQKLLCIQTTVDGAPRPAPRPAPGPAPRPALRRNIPLPAKPPSVNDPSPATILPPTPDQRPVSDQVSPVANSHQAVANTMDLRPQTTFIRHSTASLDRGEEMVDPTEEGAGQGRRSLTTWYSSMEIEDQKPSDESFWSISNQSIVGNLGALGVRFNDDGQLVEFTGGQFQYDSFSDDKATNQMRYEEIGEQITKYVHNLLETKLHMERYLLPIDASDDEPRSFIFATADYKTNEKKLLVLVHGPGVPRAGQWARKVIMNDSLVAGTQIPWIQEAVKEGYAVIVLNPNHNKHPVTETPIRENEDGKKHALYVWDKVIATGVKAAKIVFMAHSAGFANILHLATEREKEFRDRVVGIALADSHPEFGSKSSVADLFAKRARNWASSDKPLDTALTFNRNMIPKYSAGEKRHEWTAGSCIPSAIRFLNERCKKK